MSDAALANYLLGNHADKSDLGLDAPRSVAAIQERLDRANSGCSCGDSVHENALHDLASSDLPVLIAAYENVVTDLATARNVIEQVRPALESIANLLAFSSRDWGQARDLAWLWGIVHGWDDEDHEEDSAMPEQARAHGWDDAEVARLRRLHDAFARILDEAERGEGS